MNPQHPFTHAATSSFTNYPSQQSLMNRNSMNNTPVSSSYQYQNTSSVADLNLQIPIQHYNSQSSNNNNIYSNNNVQSNSTGFDYNSPPLKSHMHNSAGGSNNSYFQNSQYNFSQPQQSMHNYHHYGVTGNYQPSSHNVNNSSSFNIHPSQDLSSFKQHQQQETLSSKQSMNSQSPSNQNTVATPHNYFSTTSVTTQNSKQPLDNSPKQHSVNQQKPTDSVTSSYQTPSNTFTPTSSAEMSKTKSPAKTPTNSTESNDDSASDEESTNSPNARRGKKSTRACEACRRHHRKCDGGNPCQTCSGKGIGCVYTERKKRGPKNEATKILKREVEELKEKLTINEKIKGEWEQKCKELAKILGVSITLNDQNIPVFGNIPDNQTNNVTFSNAQLISQCNDQSYTPVVFDSSGAIDASNPLSTIPVFSISLSTEEENNKKRKKVEENLENPKKQKLDKSCSSEVIETLDLTQARDSSIPMDGQRFALSTMVTRFINIWDKYVHPFHSLLPVKWQSAMPDLLYDIIRNDGVHSENTFFMYSLICNSARSLGDIMLSRELHHKAMSLYSHHVNNPDPRVGFALVLLSYYSMSVGNLRKAIAYCKDALRISEALEKPQLNLQMNVFLSIASISDDYEERRVNFKRLGQTKQICDVIMSVTGEVQNEITHGGNTNFKDLIAQMADLLRLKNMSSSNVTLMHEIAIYGILILCLHKAGYRDLALNYGRKLLEISKDSNFKHCCIGTSSSAIAQAATMFLDFEGYPEFYECMSIMDELSMRYELAGLMKKNVEERFVLMSNHLSSGGSSSGSSNDNSPNMAPFL